MRTILLSFLFSLPFFIHAQNSNAFPQAEINNLLQKGLEHHQNLQSNIPTHIAANSNLMPVLNEMAQIKKDPLARLHNPQQIQTLDTLIVGLVPNDTLRISGSWNHTGPIWILGTG